MNKKYKILLISIIIPFSLFGQVKQNNSLLKDTIEWNDITKTSFKDTLFINNQIKSDRFYDSLFVKASKNTITKTALNLLLVKNPSSGNFIGIENIDAEKYFRLYAGKKIRNIELVKLDVFGPSIKDTTAIATKWYERFGNNTHISTRDHIIKNNLLFVSGDTINPILFADNERIIRDLDFIKDVSIQIAEIPNNVDYIDVLIITKDVYSAGIFFDIIDSKSGVLEIYENNIAGIGHRLHAKLYTDTEENPPTGYEFNYRINNIAGSFLKANFQYLKVFDTEKYGIAVTRNFFSFNTEWAGGISIYQTSELKDIKKTDTTLIDVRLNYSSQDIWIGKSFLLNTNNWQYQNRTRLVIATRYINNTFYKGPEVSERYNFQYHDNQIALIGLAYSRQKYYKSNLIYGFGKTEDIPIGTLVQINTGLEKDEFYKRLYLGLKFSTGTYYPKIGYLNFHSEFGGSFYDKTLEQGVATFRGQTISNLHSFGSLKLREFLSMNYTRGFNRFDDERIFIKNTDIWGLSSDNLYGIQKISFHSELNAFTNLHVYNFKFLFFGFGDLGFIGPENKSVFKNKMYSGIGVGVRIRNENLVFKTFLLRLAYYPTTPDDVKHYFLMISGENYNTQQNFEPTSPSIVTYQ